MLRSLFILAISLIACAIAEAQDAGVGRRTGLGTNLSGIGSIATQWDFVDLMKGSNPWVYDGGPKAGQRVPVDALGNPQLQPGEAANTLLRLKIVDASQNRAPDYPSGQFTIQWEGAGQFFLTGDGDFQSVSAAGAGTRTFTAATGSDTLFLRIASVDAANPLRNLRVLMPGYASGQPHAGERFHELFVERTIEPFGSLRFMDWGRVNGTTHSQWNQRTRDGANQYSIDTGVPIEEQLRLANLGNGDAWFCMPAAADDDYVRKFARAVLYGVDAAGEPYAAPQAQPHVPPLAADRKVYVEYANEVWNNGFEGFRYVTQQAQAAGLNPQGLNEDFAKQWAAEVRRDFALWTAEFAAAGQQQRLKRVAAIQAANRFISPIFLKQMVVGGVPQFDVISPAFYVGVDSSGYGAATTKDKILDDLFANLTTALDPTVTTFLPNTPYTVVGPRGDWLLWKQFADQYDAELVAYEGGQHVTTPGIDVPWYDDYLAAQRDERMYDFYTAWLEAVFDTARADGVEIFSSVDLISQFGAWGYLESQDQPLESAPKYRAIVDFARSRGDFDLNGWYNATDIDLVRTAAGQAPTGELAAFDMNGDGAIDEADVARLLATSLRTTYGDVNLDGAVDGADLARIAGGFGQSGAWIDGDQTGDGMVDGADFLVWQRRMTLMDEGARAILEPSGGALLGPVLLLLAPRERGMVRQE